MLVLILNKEQKITVHACGQNTKTIYSKLCIAGSWLLLQSQHTTQVLQGSLATSYWLRAHYSPVSSTVYCTTRLMCLFVPENSCTCIALLFICACHIRGECVHKHWKTSLNAQ